MYSLRSIHKLYLVLKSSLPEKDSEYLIDEVDRMLDKIEVEKFLESLAIMFPKKDFSKLPDVELLVWFIKGLKQSNFFEYANFVKGLKK